MGSSRPAHSCQCSQCVLFNRQRRPGEPPLSRIDPSGFGEENPCGEGQQGESCPGNEGGREPPHFPQIIDLLVTDSRLGNPISFPDPRYLPDSNAGSDTRGSEASPGGGSAGAGEPQGDSIKNGLCKAGNSVAEFADKLGNVSGKLELTGLGAVGVGFATAQPGLLGAGLALAATGGTGNIGASVFQFSAGLLQGVGGGGYSNSGNAALSLVTGFALSRGILGPATSGYRTFSQRAADQFANGTATVVGGVNDLYTSLIEAAAPKQVSCPGGN